MTDSLAVVVQKLYLGLYRYYVDALLGKGDPFG